MDRFRLGRLPTDLKVPGSNPGGSAILTSGKLVEGLANRPRDNLPGPLFLGRSPVQVAPEYQANPNLPIRHATKLFEVGNLQVLNHILYAP